MKAIYEKDGLYSSLRPVVDWCCRHSYRRFEMHGEENLPEDGALILAPNHTNTLMDALVMLRAYKGPTVFGARADIFKNRQDNAFFAYSSDGAPKGRTSQCAQEP